MIPDEDEPEPLDFERLRFIGRAKLGFTDRQTGRLTMKRFNRAYRAYKDEFDLELLLRRTGTTYAEAFERGQRDEEWF